MDTLYYYPGACSLSVHAVLEETGHAYEAKKIDIHGGENETADYLAIHPRGLVPALVTEGGILTEAPAILLHLAESHPEAKLLPPVGTAARTRCYEWLLLGATYPHPAFSHLMRPERFTSDAQGVEAVREHGKKEFWGALQHIDGRLAGRTFALGDSYSICDAYLMIFYLWGRFVGMPMGDLAAYSRLVARVVERPAVAKAIAEEQLPMGQAA